MIYRPSQISEAKALAIESIIKEKILSERKEGRHPTILMDTGLHPAEGLRYAMTHRIEFLRKRRERLQRLLVKQESSTTGGTGEDVIDPEY